MSSFLQHIPQQLRARRLRPSRLLLIILPSFLLNAPSTTTTPSQSHHSTAFLDGLRGIAALFVYFTHLLYTCHNTALGYGAPIPTPSNYTARSTTTSNVKSKDIRHRPHRTTSHTTATATATPTPFVIPDTLSPFRLPIVRLPYTGLSMVSLFFVISGFALSTTYCCYAQRGAIDRLYPSLSSSALRRGFRLYVPSLAVTLLIAILLQLGLYEPTRAIATDASRLTFNRENHPKRMISLVAQLGDWLALVRSFVNPFTWGYKDIDLRYNAHLWTIPIEMRASMVLFVTQLALAMLKVGVRVVIMLCLIVWTGALGMWEVMLFYAGFVMAEIDTAVADAAQGLPLPKYAKRLDDHVATSDMNHQHGRPSTFAVFAAATDVKLATQTVRHLGGPSHEDTNDDHDTDSLSLTEVIHLLNIISGLYLCSQPPGDAGRTPGWKTLYSLTPIAWMRHRLKRTLFWGAIGSCQLVFSASRVPAVRRILTVRPLRYLGRISFSVYLLHSPVIHIVGYAAMGFFWRWIGLDEPWRKETGFVLAGVVTTVALIWAADVFTRLVDVPSVRAAKWLEAQFLEGDHNASDRL